MTFNQYTSYFERVPCRALGSRASSATLFVSRRPSDLIDGTTDTADMIVAQGLLERDSPRAPLRMSSFTHTAHAQLQPQMEGNGSAPLTSDNCRDRRSAYNASSNTWTSSSGDGSEGEENDNRTMFVQEYNRMAKKYGIEMIVPDEFGVAIVEKNPVLAKHGSWIKRKLLRRTPSSATTQNKQFRHKRSITDLSLLIRAKKDTLKNKGLEDLVRLCGSSALYLPAEYAAGTLAVPTCFRATAQYLVQYASTSRGIFRIPGSHATVNALYNHYASQDEDGESVSGTVRCPTLPEHIKYDVHDVASAFKKFLAGLPSGILGRAWLFNAFVSIHYQLHADPERTKTKQSKVRARMIALAVASVVPRSQREFICAVMGLLSMIGRAAETTPREDEHGRPLPTSDLMGYGPLGIIFGPLLIGQLLEYHNSYPGRTLAQSPPDPPKLPRGRHKKNKSVEDKVIIQNGIDKVRIANCIAEMLITHWREVVRHMKNLGALKSTRGHRSLNPTARMPLLRPSASESFVLRSPPDWELGGASTRHIDSTASPSPSPRIPLGDLTTSVSDLVLCKQGGNLTVRKQRSKPRPVPSQILSGARSMSILSPTKEETNLDEQFGDLFLDATCDSNRQSLTVRPSQSIQTFHTAKSEPQVKLKKGEFPVGATETPNVELSRGGALLQVGFNSKPTAKITGKTPEPTTKQIALGYIPKKFMNLQTYLDPAPIAADAFDRDNPVEREVVGNNYTMISSPDKNERQSTKKEKQMRLLSSPTGSLEAFLNESKFQAPVPAGLVSRRIGQMSVIDPRQASPSGSREILHTQSNTVGKQRCRTGLGTGSSQTRQSYSKDPLARVSQEEDMASLASLARVIQSQEQDMDYISPPKPESGYRRSTTMGANTNRGGGNMSNGDCSELGASNRLKDARGEKIYERESPSTTTITITRRPADKQPVTPRRPVTDPVLSGRDRDGSVKALAARFNGGSPVPGYSPSPTKVVGQSPANRSQRGLAVISSYATNPASESGSNISYKAEKSLMSLRKPLPASGNPASPLTTPLSKDIIESPLCPKPLTINRRYKESGPPHWPDITSLPPSGSTRIQECKDKPCMPESPGSPHRKGDSNGGLSCSRQPISGTMIPGPDERPLDSYANLSRPPSTPVPNQAKYSQSPFDYFGKTSGASRASITSEIPNASIRGYDGKSRGTSILYTQIQDLQRQLKTKTDEADHMRKQLMTRECHQDLGTLTEQLRQAKRELGMWRSRAETAERRLDILLQLLPKQNVTDHAKDQSLADANSAQQKDNSTRAAEDDELFVDRIRTALHGGDGARSDSASQMSNGTVMHMSPKSEDLGWRL